MGVMLLRNGKSKWTNGSRVVNGTLPEGMYDKPRTRRFDTRKPNGRSNVKRREIVFDAPPQEDAICCYPAIEYVCMALFVTVVISWIVCTTEIAVQPPPPPLPVEVVAPFERKWWMALVKDFARITSASV